MKETPAWLPPLVMLTEYQGDWGLYEDTLYAYFRADFINSKPFFRGKEVGLKCHPLIRGKEAGFWHLISSGQVEDDRLPDLQRCERVRWPRAIIEHSDDDRVKVWENVRGPERRVCFWLEEEEYVVVLAQRKGYYLLWTAYMVTRPHTKKKFSIEYEAFIKAETAL